MALVVRAALLESKPFWRDEAWVASLSVEPLDWSMRGPGKAVPVGFLALTRLAGRLPVAPELALRLLPFAAGVAAILVLAALARRLGGGRTSAAVVLWIGAGLPAFVYYSRELKPYALDLLFSGLVPLLAIATLHSRVAPSRRGAAWLWLFMVLVAAPWLSFGSTFCVSATLAVASLCWWRRARRAARERWTLAVLLWLLSFATVFVFALRSQASNPRLLDAWAGDMAFITSAAPALRVVRAFSSYAHTSLSYLFPGVWPAVALLILVGFVAWPGTGRRLLALLFCVTAVEVVAAALLERYVLTQGRLLLFAAPTYVLFAAAGLLRLGRLLGPSAGPWLATGVAALASCYWSVLAIEHRIPPYRDDPSLYFRFDVIHDVDAVIGSLQLLASPGEAVFISRYSGEAFRFYNHGRVSDATVCTRLNCRNEGPALQAWIETVQRRGWMVLLDADDVPGRREIVEKAGCDIRIAAQARGARLWRLTRRAPQVTS